MKGQHIEDTIISMIEILQSDNLTPEGIYLREDLLEVFTKHCISSLTSSNERDIEFRLQRYMDLPVEILSGDGMSGRRVLFPIQVTCKSEK